MLLFLDTEFTGLNQRETRLISLALVPADGRNPFYAEIEEGLGWRRDECSSFVLDEVLPILKGGECVVPFGAVRPRLVEWFATMPRSVQVACDSEIDFEFLKAILFHAWPANLEKSYHDLRPLVDTTVYDKAVQRHYTPDRPPHNALADAEAYRLGWHAWMDANKDALADLARSKQMHRAWVKVTQG